MQGRVLFEQGDYDGAVKALEAAKAKGVAVSDPANAVLGRVPAGCTPVRLDITPDGRSVWTTVRMADAVAGYDAAKLLEDPEHARIAWVPVGPAPIGIVITRDGSFVLNTNSNRFRADTGYPQTVTVVDRERAIRGDASVVGSIAAGIFPRQLSLSVDGKDLFITNYLSNTVESIQLNN